LIISVRPHKVFDLVTTQERRVNMILPDKSSDNLVLETMIILALEKAVSAQKVFEFGTYLGETTSILAMNSGGGHVVTLDLDTSSLDMVSLDRREQALATRAVENEPCFIGQVEARSITRLLGDSCTIDLSEYYNTCQFVYVDGGHTMDVIRSDTENAFRFLRKEGPGIIAWHDYGNPDYPDVKEFLDILSKTFTVFLVAETRIAFYLKGIDIS